jgi:hypothetical protein
LCETWLGSCGLKLKATDVWGFEFRNKFGNTFTSSGSQEGLYSMELWTASTLLGLSQRTETELRSGFQSQSQSQCQSYFTTCSLQPISSAWPQSPWDSRPAFLFNCILAFIVLM